MTILPSSGLLHIEFTERAAGKVRSMLASDPGTVSFGLRVGVDPGGCAGYSYTLALSPGAEEKDLVLADSGERGFEVFVHQDLVDLLRGVRIDYVESLQSSGFSFSNPNASKACGCGTSFGTAHDAERKASDERLKAQVEDVLSDVRPYLRADGGDVEIVAAISGNGEPGSADVLVRLSGACNGCSAASVTLAEVIERRLTQALPEVGRVLLVP